MTGRTRNMQPTNELSTPYPVGAHLALAATQARAVPACPTILRTPFCGMEDENRKQIAESFEALSKHDVACRPQGMLAFLRRNPVFADSTLRVGAEKFHIHRNIVGCLSSVFFNMFFSGREEAGSRSLEIGKASTQAVSVMLDFAYGVEVGSAMSKDHELAIEVASIAERFAIPQLRGIAFKASVRHVNLDNCVKLFQELDINKCTKERRVVFRFIARRMPEVAAKSPDFKRLLAHHLRQFLSSKELVATELDKFQIILEWVKKSEKVGMEVRDELFSYMRYELLDRSEMQQVSANCEYVPTKVLWKHLERTMSPATRVPVLPCLQNPERNSDGKFLKRKRNVGKDAAVFALQIPSFLEDASSLQRPVAFHYFRYNLWIWCLHFKSDNSAVVLDVVRRERSIHPGSCFADEVQKSTVRVVTNVLSATGDFVDAMEHNATIADEIIVEFFKSRRKLEQDEKKNGLLNLLVSVEVDGESSPRNVRSKR